MTEQELLKDCLRRLNSCGIHYMLTGSMASNAWGIPRTTHDLDFVVQLLPDKIDDLVEAYEHKDYFVDAEMIKSAYQPPYQFNFLHVPSALKIDFWMLRENAFEQKMFQRKVADSYLGEEFWLATPEDIILHKLYWDKISKSDRQLNDVAGIVAVQTELDLPYLREWAERLDVTETLEKALTGQIRPKST